jgi:hypothetical protein
MRGTALLACLLLIGNYAVSQSVSTSSDCDALEVVLQRYLAPCVETFAKKNLGWCGRIFPLPANINKDEPETSAR